MTKYIMFSQILTFFSLIIMWYSRPTSSQNNLKIDSIEIPAIGRVAKIGEMYDIRTDQFVHISAIREIGPDPKDNDNSYNPNYKYIYSGSLQDKFDFMDITPSLQLSILAGLVKLEGSGQFLLDKKTLSHSIKISMALRFRTKLDIYNIVSRLRNYTDLDLLQKTNATHLIFGIQWGGYAFGSVEYYNYEQNNSELGRKGLESILTHLYNIFRGRGDVKIPFKSGFQSTLKFSLYADIMPEHLPHNILDGMKYIANWTNIVEGTNNGRGRPLTYLAFDINDLLKFVDLEVKVHKNYQVQIDELTLLYVVNALDDIQELYIKFNTKKSHALNSKFIPKRIFNRFMSSEEEFDKSVWTLRSDILKELKVARTSSTTNDTNDKLKDILNKAQMFVKLWTRTFRDVSLGIPMDPPNG